MIAGLPEDALLARPAGQSEIWTRNHELLASLVEVVSVGVAERAIKKPISVPRPQPKRVKVARDRRADVERAEGAVSLDEAMRALNEKGRVRVVPALSAGTATAAPVAAEG